LKSSSDASSESAARILAIFGFSMCAIKGEQACYNLVCRTLYNGLTKANRLSG
jgi:hypothetical protein